MNLSASMASETQDESHPTTPSTGLLQNIKRNALKKSLKLPLLMQGKHSLCSSNVSPLDEQPWWHHLLSQDSPQLLLELRVH
nr:hypothetical protein Itr_chr11CG21680 [Ipomoea trifida]